jgi:chromosomal replication initiator protein
VGDVEYRSWLRQMTLAGVEGDEVTVHLPTRFLRDWVRSHYGDKITALWRQENPAIARVYIRVGGSRPSTGLAESLAAAPVPPAQTALAPCAMPNTPISAQPRLASPPPSRGDELAGPLDPRFTFDSFVVGKPNEFAYACARRVAERPGSKEFNPLFLCPCDRRLHVGGKIHVPVHRGDPIAADDRVQGSSALGRCADDRRPAIPDRQG